MLLLVAILAIIVIGSTMLTIHLLYSAALDQQAGRLREIAQSQARLIEAVARHDSSDVQSEALVESDVLKILEDAHAQYEGFGETGEFTLARLEDDQIIFLLSHRHDDLDSPEPIPLDSELAEPMRRALRGEQGSMIGLDYRGTMVLAAYEPVSELDWGIVAKLDLAEIRSPYVRAAVQGLLPALAAVLLGAWLFTWVTRPILRRIGTTQQRFQTLVETMRGGLCIQDTDGLVRYVNDRFCQMAGRDREEIVGRPMHDCLAPESRERYIERMEQQGHETMGPDEAVFLQPDGTRIVTLMSPQLAFGPRKRAQGGFTIFTDITHLKDVETQLRREKDQAQMYLDIAGVMFVALDKSGRIELINRRGVEILGYDHYSELVGKDWFETAVPSDGQSVVRGVFERLVAGEIEPAEYFENPVQTNDASRRRIAWHNTVLRDEEGNITGTLSSGLDITEQRTAEQERLKMETHLRQGQKLESIGTLASGVAHEINNPLTGIINYAELIQGRTEDPKLKDFATGIVEEGNRVAEIVRALLSFAREERERHSPAALRDILDATLKLTAAVLRKDQIDLRIDVPHDLPLVRCRNQQIQQVFLNLINNAREALNERYPGFDEDKILRIDAAGFEQENAQWIRMVFEDHGAGIPPEIAERIFDPFFSTKPRETGTGLGLSISYGIVREHHGRLLVESEQNAYTRFILELAVNNGWRSEGTAGRREDDVQDPSC